MTAFIFSAGFNARRDREYALWDIRNLSQPAIIKKHDTSPGILTPLFDADANLIFLCGKGDTSLRWLELKDGALDVGAIPYSGQVTLSAFCLVPKQSLSILKCEVDRVLCASSDGSTIIPVSAVVPRKNNLDFNDDIFPDTPVEYCLTVEEWKNGTNKQRGRVSLDPFKNNHKQNSAAIKAPDNVDANPTVIVEKDVVSPLACLTVKNQVLPSLRVSEVQPRSSAVSYTGKRRLANSRTSVSESGPAPSFLPKHSSYRHVAVDANTKFNSLQSQSVDISPESNGFDVSKEYIAFFYQGSGGRVGIWPLKKEGRFPPKVPCVINGSDVIDFKFNPFQPNLLLTGCDDGRLRVFKVIVLMLDS
jgi:coronin-7